MLFFLANSLDLGEFRQIIMTVLGFLHELILNIEYKVVR